MGAGWEPGGDREKGGYPLASMIGRLSDAMLGLQVQSWSRAAPAMEAKSKAARTGELFRTDAALSEAMRDAEDIPEVAHRAQRAGLEDRAIGSGDGTMPDDAVA